MTALDAELDRVFDAGAELELGNGFNFLRPLKATRNAATESIDIKVVATPGTGIPHTIAAGVVALQSASPDVQLETEALAASDDLTNITPHADMGPSVVVILKTTASTRDVVVKHSASLLVLKDAADFTLATTSSRIALMWSGVKWHELWRST
jgi:hypothetical protein